MKKKPLKKNSSLSRRLHFPADEARLPWLPMLLDAYAIADTGLAVAVRDVEKRRKKKLACGKGCGNCCRHQKDLPLYPHELVGIYWYVTEKIDQAMRNILRMRLAASANDSSCPFVIDNSCSIHPLRPFGCRQFNVFTARCAPGEDPYYTRRHDVLEPLQEYTDRVFAAVLPFYHLRGDEGISEAIRMVRSQIMNLRCFDWKKLVTVLDQTASDSPERKTPPPENSLFS